MNPYEIIKTIHFSEKAGQLNELGKYVFKVSTDANKIQIRQAVEKLYNVKVSAVNVLNVEGKKKRVGRSPKVGKRSDWKKAVVTLKEGKIELV